MSLEVGFGVLKSPCQAQFSPLCMCTRTMPSVSTSPDLGLEAHTYEGFAGMCTAYVPSAHGDSLELESQMDQWL